MNVKLGSGSLSTATLANKKLSCWQIFSDRSRFDLGLSGGGLLNAGLTDLADELFMSRNRFPTRPQTVWERFHSL